MIVTRTSQSEFVAVSGECTHEQCQVEAFDASSMRIICDCHGSRYDVKGIVQAGSPATKNLQQFSTTYTSGADTVFVNVPGFVATSAKNDAQITTAVEQNFPNPAVGMTTIEYSVAEPTKVSIIVYSFLGKEIIRLVDKFHEPGIYKVQCNASALGNGVYLYRMSTSEGFVQTRKLTISQ